MKNIRPEKVYIYLSNINIRGNTDFINKNSIRSFKNLRLFENIAILYILLITIRYININEYGIDGRNKEYTLHA